MTTPTARAASHSPADLRAIKQAARAAALETRARLAFDAGALLAEVVLRDLPPPPGSIVSGFWPIGDEIDLRPLLLALAARGHPLALPETGRRGEPLLFRRWRPGEALIPGRFGTVHPAGEPVSPDFVLTPLLAFDRWGNRLGYGAGYYDRSLKTLPHAFRLGCAFSFQESAAVPAGPDDQRLDAVATERGIVNIQNGA